MFLKVEKGKALSSDSAFRLFINKLTTRLSKYSQLIIHNSQDSIFAIMQALIYKSTGSWYIAKTGSGQVYNARIKGVFKIDDITSTNPIAVGDIVKLVPETEEGNTAMITE